MRGGRLGRCKSLDLAGKKFAMGCIKSLLGYRTVITSQMYGDKNQGSMEGSKELCIGGYASVRITTGRPAIDQYGTSELAKQQQPPTGRKGK